MAVIELCPRSPSAPRLFRQVVNLPKNVAPAILHAIASPRSGGAAWGESRTRVRRT